MNNFYKASLISGIIFLSACTSLPVPTEKELVRNEPVITPVSEPVVITKTITVDCTPQLLREIKQSEITIDKSKYEKTKDIVGYVKALEANSDMLRTLYLKYREAKEQCSK